MPLSLYRWRSQANGNVKKSPRSHVYTFSWSKFKYNYRVSILLSSVLRFEDSKFSDMISSWPWRAHGQLEKRREKKDNYNKSG